MAKINKKRKKEKDGSKKLFAACAAAAGLLVILTVAVAVSLRGGREAILFYVDGEPVYEEELQFVIDKQRLTVRNHIMVDYDVDSESFSWDGEYGGRTALDRLRESAVRQCVQNKMIQIVAREVKVADKIDYPSLRAMNKEDSELRQKRVENGQVIYGNTSYKAADYYDYVLSNLEQQSYYVLVEDGTLSLTEEEKQKVYEEHKEALEEAGMDESAAETIGLQEKYAEYIQKRADSAKVDKFDEGGIRDVLNRVK